MSAAISAFAITATAPSGETTVGLARPKAAKLPTSPSINPIRATQKSGWCEAGPRASSGLLAMLLCTHFCGA